MLVSYSYAISFNIRYFEERDVLEERGKWKEEREYSAADNATDNNQEKSQWTFQGNIQGTNHISFHFLASLW